jgi:hypothetical protein
VSGVRTLERSLNTQKNSQVEISRDKSSQLSQSVRWERGGGFWWENITPQCAKTTGNPPPPDSMHAELTYKGSRLSATDRETDRLCRFPQTNLLSVGRHALQSHQNVAKNAKLYWLFNFLLSFDENDSIYVKYFILSESRIRDYSVVNHGLTSDRIGFEIRTSLKYKMERRNFEHVPDTVVCRT